MKRWPLALLVGMWLCAPLYPESTAPRITAVAARLDPGHRLTLDGASRSPDLFVASRGFSPGFGFTTATVWLRITAQNPGPTPARALLEVAYPHLDELELYQIRPDGEATAKLTGDHFPFASRPRPSRTFVFPLLLAPGESSLYLRCRTTSTAEFPLRLQTPLAFATRENLEHSLLWFLYGMMVMLMLYNLFVYLAVKERAILFLMFFITSYLLFLFTLNGMSFQYFWPGHPALNAVALPLFILLGDSFGCLFVAAFCRTFPARHPLPRVIYGLALFFLVAAAATLGLSSYRSAIRLAIGATLLFLLTLGVAGVLEWRRGNRAARFFLLAIGIFTVGVGVFIGKTLGLLPPSPATTWSIQVAATLLVIFLSLSLSDRINRMKHELEVLNQSLELQLGTDPLTGLPNRFRLLEDVQEAVEPALMILNIDAFREINDFYGDELGDQVLRAFSERLRPFAQGHDLCFYRLQADEYALLADRPLNPGVAEGLMERLIHEVGDQPIRLAGNDIPLGITIGCAAFAPKLEAPSRGRWKELATRADMALKRAKRENRHFLVFDESWQVRKEYETNLLWTRKLKESLTEGRIVPYFQPIVNNHTRQVEKYECLVRLLDTDGQVISPVTFLGVSKKSKLYPHLTRTMVEQCMTAFRDLPYEFSINLSIEDILAEDTCRFILEKLGENPAIGPRMVFEIVESEGIESFARISEFIRQVKQWGCKIAIDDFGSGFSNYDYILKLAVDYIKIDASLIRPLDHDRNAQVITETIVTTCRKLGFETIAEFVHSPAVFAKVCDLGIDFSQGYHLGAPQDRVTAPVAPDNSRT